MGKGKPPTLTYVNKAHVRTPKKHVHWGRVLIAAGVFCFWIEWHWHGRLIVPLIVGLNLVFAGLRLIYWGAGGSKLNRQTILRIRNSIDAKEKKYAKTYSSLAHVRNRLFVLGITAFDGPFARLACQRAIETVLYGYDAGDLLPL